MSTLFAWNNNYHSYYSYIPDGFIHFHDTPSERITKNQLLPWIVHSLELLTDHRSYLIWFYFMHFLCCWPGNIQNGYAWRVVLINESMQEICRAKESLPLNCGIFHLGWCGIIKEELVVTIKRCEEEQIFNALVQHSCMKRLSTAGLKIYEKMLKILYRRLIICLTFKKYICCNSLTISFYYICL